MQTDLQADHLTLPLSVLHDAIWITYTKLEGIRGELDALSFSLLDMPRSAKVDDVLQTAREVAQKTEGLDADRRCAERMIVLLTSEKSGLVCDVLNAWESEAKQRIAGALNAYDHAVDHRKEYLSNMAEYDSSEAGKSLDDIHRAGLQLDTERSRLETVREYAKKREFSGCLQDVITAARADLFCALSPLDIEDAFNNNALSRKRIVYQGKDVLSVLTA